MSPSMPRFWRRRHLGRVRRAMRPRGPQPRLGRVAIVTEIVAAVAFVAFLLSLDGARTPFAPATFELRAEFSDASGLRTDNHSPVTVAGVPMGRVESVEVEGGRAIATLALEPGAAGRIPAGSSARIVPRSALQDLTVDIEPGPAAGAVLADGDTVPAARTSTTVGADRVLGVLDADTRAQAQILLDQLGAGLDGRGGELGDDLERLARVVDSTAAVTGALDERRELLRRFVDDLDTIFTTLAERRAQLAGAVEAGADTLAVTASRDSELSRSIAALPSALEQTRGALDAVDELSRPLEPALAELEPTAEDLPEALRGIRDVIAPADELLGAVDDLARRGGGGVAGLRRALERLGPAADAAGPAVPDLATIVAAVDENKEGIGLLGDRFSGVFSTNDVNGPILRGLGFFEPVDPANVGFGGGDAALAKAQASTVRALTEVCLKDNPVACLARYLVPALPGAVVDGGVEVNLRIPKRGLIALIVAVALAALLFVLLMARFGGPAVRLSEPYRVTASLADTKGLAKRSEVLVRGVAVGVVESLTPRGDEVVAELSIDDAYAPLTAAATVRVGEKTLFGEAYVDLDPGGGGGAPLESGERIAPSRVLPAAADVDEALEALDRPARRDLVSILGELGAGLEPAQSAERLSGSYAQLERVAAELDQLTGELDGQEEAIAAAVGYAGDVVTTLGEHESALRRIVAGSRTTLEAIGSESAALRSGVAKLPGVLAVARDTLADARPLLEEIDPAARDLALASPDLERTLERIPAVAEDTDALLAALPPLEDDAVAFLGHAGEVLDLAAPVAEPLADALRNIEPIAAFLSARKEAFASWFSNTGDLGSHQDAKGYFARFFVGFEPATTLGLKSSLPTNTYTGPNDALDNQPYTKYPRLEPYDPKEAP